MPGRSERAAWLACCEPIRSTISGVDLAARLEERRFDNGVYLLASPVSGIPFGPNLRLSFSIQFEPYWLNAAECRMTARRYDYAIASVNDVPVFSWHWHPASRRSQVTYPHMHVPMAERYSSRHIPTGRVAIEDVVLFGFSELGVTPTSMSATAIIEKARENHKRNRSWH